jgi:hypothetical protein
MLSSLKSTLTQFQQEACFPMVIRSGLIILENFSENRCIKADRAPIGCAMNHLKAAPLRFD